MTRGDNLAWEAPGADPVVVGSDSPRRTPEPNKPHTVLYVANAAKIGGGNKVLMDLIANLDRSRFTPSLVVPAEGPLLEWAENAGIPCAISTADDWGAIRGMARRTLELRRIVKQARADIVHAAAPMAYRALGVAAWTTGALRVCHLGFPPEPDELNHAFLAGPDAVIGCYEGQADEHRREILAMKPRCLVVGIPNGVDVDRFTPGLPSGPIAAVRGNASTVIAILGHISDVKGYPTFVDAAASIARLHDGCEFWGIGAETTQRGAHAAIEQRAVALGIRDRIRFLGFRSDVHEVLKAVDIVALPSLAEGFPLAVLEAMSAGKAVVATPVGGVPEAVTPHVTGLLVPPSDPDALSRAFQYLIQNPEARRRLGDAARRRVVSQFSVARFATRVQDIYTVVLNEAAIRRPLEPPRAS